MFSAGRACSFLYFSVGQLFFSQDQPQAPALEIRLRQQEDLARGSGRTRKKCPGCHAAVFPQVRFISHIFGAKRLPVAVMPIVLGGQQAGQEGNARFLDKAG